MANWLSSTIHVDADQNSVEALKQLEKIHAMANSTLCQETNDTDPRWLNADPGWLGFLLLNQGIDPSNFSCRGFIRTVSKIAPSLHGHVGFYMEVEEAWEPHYDLWETIMSLETFNKLSFSIDLDN